MSPPPPGFPILQELANLESTSQDFPDQLHGLLYGDEYRQCLSNLQNDHSSWLVEHLDQTLGTLNPSSSIFRKCLRELRKLCSAREVAPPSYTICPRRLTIDPNPTTGGRFGDVYRGTLDDSRVCIKRVRVYQDASYQDSKAFFKEAVMWKYMIHPNVLPLLGITTDPFQLVSAWMSGGDLSQYTRLHPDADRLRLMYEIAKGLFYLHSCNVIHGDLKGRNILVDESGRVRIADFGFAAVTQNPDSVGNSTTPDGCTLRWTAPEILNGGLASREGDVFSFAMVMIEVFTGAIPFYGRSNNAVVVSILRGHRPGRPVDPTFSHDLWSLTQRCWDGPHDSRPSVSDVLGTLDVLACRHLAGHTLTGPQSICLINAIFSDHDWSKVIDRVSGDYAQEFLDEVDEALGSPDLTPEIRRRCLSTLYRLCGREALVPRSLLIPLCYNPNHRALCGGDFADVWKGSLNGKDVAAKVLRVGWSNELAKVKRRFCREVMAWRCLQHPNVLGLSGVTIDGYRFVMVSEWMKNGHVGRFLENNPHANRMQLIGDTTRGLIYMHDQGMAHGNLRGANILIDNDGRARLADFTLLRMIPEGQNISTTAAKSGNARWMSPEIVLPAGSKEGFPTRASDCYSLGMVMYEILSGWIPFYQESDHAVILKILDGDRPTRPQGPEGGWFTDSIWEILELCWQHEPADRISAKAVLQYLEGGSSPSGLPRDLNGDAVMVYVGDQPDGTLEED